VRFRPSRLDPADPIKRHRARRERSHPKAMLTTQASAVALDLLENSIDKPTVALRLKADVRLNHSPFNRSRRKGNRKTERLVTKRFNWTGMSMHVHAAPRGQKGSSGFSQRSLWTSCTSESNFTPRMMWTLTERASTLKVASRLSKSGGF
jgi:hypothetical protein